MNKSKTFMTVSIAILIVTIIANSITYAWYTWSTSSEQETSIVTNLGAARVFYDSGANITNANLKPTATKEEGIVKNITVKTSKSATYKISFNLYLDVISLDNGLKDASFKYALYKKGTETAVAQGNFLNATLKTCETNNTNHIELVMDETITTTTSEYTLYIWIDGTMSNPSSMQSQNFNFKLHADGQNAVIGETLLQHINNLYNNAAKSPVENGEEGSKISYNYASSVSLMNDRLGTMSVGANDGNIRYYGANPNNYIDIGDVYEADIVIKNWEEPLKLKGVPESMMPTTTDDCMEFLQCSVLTAEGLFITEADCEIQLPYLFASYGFPLEEACSTTLVSSGTPKSLYRIIGLFKDVELADGSKNDLIKVIRNEPIGNYSWDQSPSDINNGLGINEWSQADLMKLLNPGYESETVGGSLYWNSGSGSCHTFDLNIYTSELKPCDFTNSGLSTNTKNNIETVKWNLGGWFNSSIYPNQIYEYERLDMITIDRPEVWPGKVALAYLSDYGYAVDLHSCRKTLNYYTNCIGTNWMYNSVTANENTLSWLLTVNAASNSSSWGIVEEGYVEAADNELSLSVSPVFYLDSELGIVTGDGSEENPYVVR